LFLLFLEISIVKQLPIQAGCTNPAGQQDRPRLPINYYKPGDGGTPNKNTMLAKTITTKHELAKESRFLRALAQLYAENSEECAEQLKAEGYGIAEAEQKLEAGQRPIVRLLRTAEGLHLSLNAYRKPIQDWRRAA
jgi:hypothetical protein